MRIKLCQKKIRCGARAVLVIFGHRCSDKVCSNQRGLAALSACHARRFGVALYRGTKVMNTKILLLAFATLLPIRAHAVPTVGQAPFAVAYADALRVDAPSWPPLW
jgi:hypothetical protein